MDDLVCHVEMRPDGVVLVRVPPLNPKFADTTPDAVFSFRAGDPQYGYWRTRWLMQNGEQTQSQPTPAEAV
jgi:hypothetical protein